jgi:hypothetical protein
MTYQIRGTNLRDGEWHLMMVPPSGEHGEDDHDESAADSVVATIDQVDQADEAMSIAVPNDSPTEARPQASPHSKRSEGPDLDSCQLDLRGRYSHHWTHAATHLTTETSASTPTTVHVSESALSNPSTNPITTARPFTYIAGGLAAIALSECSAVAAKRLDCDA